VCGDLYGVLSNEIFSVPRESLDHIFPRRWLIQFGFNPHVIVNLISVCGRCHAMKKRAENYLFRADALTYVSQLAVHRWPMERVEVAAQYYGLVEIVEAIHRRLVLA